MTGSLSVAAGLFTVALAIVHLLGGGFRFEDTSHRRRFLSASGGASVAYVFVLLLPEVSEAALVAGELREEAFLAEQLVYLVALSGFVSAYGVEVFVVHRTDRNAESSSLVYRVHVAVFSLYSGLIAYLLFHQEVTGVLNLFFYAVAMALHFGVTDYGLSQHHGDDFERAGRWVLAVATLLGGATGYLTSIDRLAITTLFGFLAGTIVLNVIKEELPDLDQSRFAAFAGGATAYTLVLLLS